MIQLPQLSSDHTPPCMPHPSAHTTRQSHNVRLCPLQELRVLFNEVHTLKQGQEEPLADTPYARPTVCTETQQAHAAQLTHNLLTQHSSASRETCTKYYDYTVNSD